MRNSVYIKSYKNLVGDTVGIPKRLISSMPIERVIGNKLKSQGDNWMVDTYSIVLAKDYLASLTDKDALREYWKHVAMSLD